jgi:hypothetical protein
MAKTGREAVAGALCHSPIVGATDMAITLGAVEPARNPRGNDTMAQ